jgi:site-specific DNA-methyltransferase (adenine-specific)
MFSVFDWQHERDGVDETESGVISIDGCDPAVYDPFRYFAKPSKREREAGCDHIEAKQQDESREPDAPGANNPRNRGGGERKNSHPTVKNIALMRWLVKLVTPPGGVVLDPFTGSGTTGCAAVLEGFSFLGIEREQDYVNIATARIAYWHAKR